jgi:hypothetical protein
MALIDAYDHTKISWKSEDNAEVVEGSMLVHYRCEGRIYEITAKIGSN